MSTKKVSIEEMAEAINSQMEEYATLAATEMKAAVKKTATSVKKEIQSNAPEDTGAYKKSWATKTQSQGTHSISMVVYSKNRYQLAHLLEKGHALRNGGRVAARPHIAPAEENGKTLIEELIRSAL